MYRYGKCDQKFGIIHCAVQRGQKTNKLGEFSSKTKKYM